MSNIDYDKILYEKLLKEWENRFIKEKKSNWRLVSLFRSLEMAYQACSIPFRNHGTMYDYGSSIALWVSAFEVLVHKKRKHVNYEDVLDKLDCKLNFDKRLNYKKYKVPKYRGKGKKIGVKIQQKLYYQMYSTRNKFLHGEPVKSHDLHAFRKLDRYGLNCYAPIIYKLALLSQLKINTGNTISEEYLHSSNAKHYKLQRALLTSLQPRKE